MADRGDAWLARGVAALALALAFSVGLYRVRTFDTFFHLAAGRFIREQGQLPTVDPFSFTHRGAPWLDHSWGFQILLERLHALGGFSALSVLQATLACTLLAIAARESWAYVIGLLPFFAYREVIEARPHLLAFVCLASTIALTTRARGREVLWSVPIYALWSTVHGSHLLAFVFLGLALAAGPERVYWALSFACCVALSLWLAPNALGQGGQHVASAFLEGNISEWYPVTFGDLVGTWPGRTFLLLLVLSLTGLLLTRERRLLHLVAFALLLVLAFSARRMLALFALGAQPLWLPWAAHALARLPRLGALAASLAIVGLLPYGPFEAGVGLASDRFPESAVSWLRAHPALRRVYNAYNYGGYLMWTGWPPDGVFVDGRAITVYPSEFLERFERAYDDPPTFEGLRTAYHTDCVLLPTHSERVRKLRRYLKQSWQLRYGDEVSEIYTPRPWRDSPGILSEQAP
jgi:hypothetical protein